MLRVLGLSGGVPRRVRARMEVASPARAQLFPGADSLSADAALNPTVRKTVRQRARTQVENDPLAEGIVDTVANDTVGCGPKLRVLIESQKDANIIETRWEQWCAAVNFGEKIRLMRRVRCVDGESFGVFIDNPAHGDRVTLDFKLVETDQVTDNSMMPDPKSIDGIKLDDNGNPVSYNIAKGHPGDLRGVNPLDYAVFKAEDVIHYFKIKRPGQHRGIPDIAPALLRFAYLQRFTYATVMAAEHAANHAGIVHSEAPPDGAQDVEPMDPLEFQPNTFTTLPAGWDMKQMIAEHPATTYEMFRREILSDIARCVHMPLNVAILNSSGFNFSSGKLDHIVYHQSIGVEREFMTARVVERVFQKWLQEAILITGYLPLIARTTPLPRSWAWPAKGAIDPIKESLAVTENLSNGTSTWAKEFASKGLDWRDEMSQRVTEMAEMKRLMAAAGITHEDVANMRGTPLAQKNDTQKGSAINED